MAQQVTCPRCKAVLRVPEHVAGRALSCPRCLTEIVPPNAPGDVLAQPRPSFLPPDALARNDSRITTLVVLSLLLLCLVALVLLATRGQDQLGRMFALMCIFAVVDLAAVIALAVWFFPRITRRLESPVLGFFIGLPLFLLLAAAVVIFFFVTCYGIVVAL